MAAIAAWVKVSSPARFLSPFGDWVWPAPYAALLSVDPATTAYTDLSGLSEGGLVFFVPTGQLAASFAADRLPRAVGALPSLPERVAHLFGHRLGVDLPDVLTLALSSPGQSIMDALSAEGLGGIDLDAVECLCVPQWAVKSADRATVAALCQHP